MRVGRRRPAWGFGILTLVVGLGLAPDAEVGCRQVCTQETSCDGLMGEERWRCVAMN